MGKRARKFNRLYGTHKLPNESKQEFHRRAKQGQLLSTPRPSQQGSPFTEPSPVLTEEQLDAATGGKEYNPLHDKPLAELKALAADAELPGRSKMNKGQLADALFQLQGA